MTQEHSLPAQEAHALEASYWPLILSVTLTIALIGVLIRSTADLVGLIIAIVGGLASLVAMVAWAAERFHGPIPAGLTPAARVAEQRATLPGFNEYGRGLATPIITAHPLAYWGLVWFIATEAVFFANLIAAYIYLRATTSPWPPAGVERFELLFPVINTIILLGSGLPALYADRAIVRDDRKGAMLGLGLAAAMGAIFLGGQAFEYLSLGYGPDAHIFGAAFFTLTGFHGAHVLAGIGLLVTVLVMTARGRFSSRHHLGVQAATAYWHFVDIVWIALFTLLYLLQ